MKILILSPLFLPDTGAPATYVKTLLPHLKSHDVTLVLYGHLPESTGEHVHIITLDKRWSKPYLMIKSFFTLLKKGKESDLIIINNGPSTELPALLVSYFFKIPMFLCLSDPLAIKAGTKGVRGFIHTLCAKRMRRIITLPAEENLYLPAEKLPFTPFDTKAEAARQEWWNKHVSDLTSI